MVCVDIPSFLKLILTEANVRPVTRKPWLPPGLLARDVRLPFEAPCGRRSHSTRSWDERIQLSNWLPTNKVALSLVAQLTYKLLIKHIVK